VAAEWGAPLLATLLAALLGGEAPAVTVQADAPRPWTRPGANPCNGVCGDRWALERMRNVMPAEVHDELARRFDAGEAQTDYLVGTGDDIRAMSYAKGGEPFVDFSRRVAQFPPGVDHPARGHAVMHQGVLYRFVQIAACSNWALIVAQDPGAVPAVLSWLSPDRPILLSGLDDDIIIGGAGNDTLAPATEDLPVANGGGANSPRRIGYLYFPPGGNGPVVRYSPFLAGAFGRLGFGGGFGSRLRNPADTPHGAFPSSLAEWTPPAAPRSPGPSSSSPARGSTGANPVPPGRSVPPGTRPDAPTPFVPPASPEEPITGERLPMPIPLPGTLALFIGWLAAFGAMRLRRA
jgi:hypothetical protein